jgi:hypothetical protein
MFKKSSEQGLNTSYEILSTVLFHELKEFGIHIRILFLQTHRETDRFFEVSGVMSSQSDRGFFHYRRTAFSSMIKSRVGNVLAKASALRINLNIDGSPIVSKSHTHPSHSQTSRFLTSSLSLGVPVPRPTQCLRDV